jgi:hypothetical protein
MSCLHEGNQRTSFILQNHVCMCGTTVILPWRDRSIEHAQDSLVQACAVVSIGVSDIGVAAMGNKKELLVTFVDHVPRFEATFSPSSIN